MGQRLSKTFWTASASSKDEKNKKEEITSKNPTQRFKTSNKQGLESSSSPSAVLFKHLSEIKGPESSNNVDSTEISLEDEISKTLLQSDLSSSPTQFVIRIQLTKMENNNNSTNNLGESCIQPNALRISSSPTSRVVDSSELSPSLDNNLNITCGTHSIINLSISNNFVCDAQLNQNNLNIINSAETNSNSIHCLNLVENRQPDVEMENNLNKPSSTKGSRCQMNNIFPMNANNRPKNVSSCSDTSNNRNTSSKSNSNLAVPAANAAVSIRCIDGVFCRCNLSCSTKKTFERNCDSGHTSLCGQSNFEGDRRHCCRSKKLSSAYPSKLRCCQCMCNESSNANNSKSVEAAAIPNEVPSTECSYRSNFASNPVCRNSNSLLSSTQASSLQGQMCHPPVHNLIVLSVNPNGQHIFVDPQKGDIQFLPVLCSTTAGNGGTTAISGFGPITGPMVHSQADYSHCLVPDLEKITNCSFYWGKMDRYEAERLLEGKPEGTFLLRDSAQEEYLFSVTFRKYGRSLHARIEQLGHKFSFDCHDPGVYTASTVTGLLEHYKDPSCVMFFEPMLTIPLHRNFTFSLQQLCRATIVSHITYDGINELQLPNSLKSHLKEYHYKYKVRETPLDESLYACP